MLHEKPSTNRNNVEYYLEDHEGEPYYHLLLELPPSLRQIHLAKIEEALLSPEEAYSYVQGILEARREATTETQVSDPELLDLLANPTYREAFLHQLESDIFTSPTIGAGSTAKIKYAEINPNNGPKTFKLAVKYLLTPTAKTLSAAAEHDMLHEVERIKTIEEIELAADVKRIRVPHPYLHHKNEAVQCYAMEHIDGADLLEILENRADLELMDTLAEQFNEHTEAALAKEFERFLTSMHTYCLHGDIKPANIMVDRDGNFYVIDFGQSVLVQHIGEEGQGQLDNLKELEHGQVKTTIKLLARKLAEHRAHRAAPATT